VFNKIIQEFNLLNAELNPICHLLAWLGAHLILHGGRIRVKILIKKGIKLDCFKMLKFALKFT
jgi:hypothetical protein